MSFPNLPDVSPDIDLSREDVINLLLASIAFEELGLSHIINSEAEKIQYVLGTIEGQTPLEIPPTIEDLLEIDHSVEQTLRSVIKSQMLLQFKLEDTISISTTSSTSSTTTTTSSSTTTTTTESTTTTTTESTTTTTTESTTTTTTESTTTTTESTTTTSTTTTTTTTSYAEAGSAWGVGTGYGEGNAQYFTLADGETTKSVVLGLGNNYDDIGSVVVTRNGNTIDVTFTTDSPYVMSEVQLEVSNAIPTTSAPGQFTYQYSPGGFFGTYTFEDIDVSAFAGVTIYLAAHAKIYVQQ